MGVKLQSSSGGSVEIAAPVTASNYTLTAPATSSTIDTLARTGNVLQVVQGATSTQVNSSSSTYVDTGLTATITPASVSSKILVFVIQNGVGKNSGSATTANDVTLYRNTTLISSAFSNAYTSSSVINIIGTVGFTLLDSPSSTSAITYKTQFRSRSGTSDVFVQSDTSTSTITLMEIAG